MPKHFLQLRCLAVRLGLCGGGAQARPSHTVRRCTRGTIAWAHKQCPRPPAPPTRHTARHPSHPHRPTCHARLLGHRLQRHRWHHVCQVGAVADLANEVILQRLGVENVVWQCVWGVCVQAVGSRRGVEKACSPGGGDSCVRCGGPLLALLLPRHTKRCNMPSCAHNSAHTRTRTAASPLHPNSLTRLSATSMVAMPCCPLPSVPTTCMYALMPPARIVLMNVATLIRE